MAVDTTIWGTDTTTENTITYYSTSTCSDLSEGKNFADESWISFNYRYKPILYNKAYSGIKDNGYLSQYDEATIWKNSTTDITMPRGFGIGYAPSYQLAFNKPRFIAYSPNKGQYGIWRYSAVPTVYLTKTYDSTKIKMVIYVNYVDASVKDRDNSSGVSFTVYTCDLNTYFTSVDTSTHYIVGIYLAPFYGTAKDSDMLTILEYPQYDTSTFPTDAQLYSQINSPIYGASYSAQSNNARVIYPIFYGGIYSPSTSATRTYTNFAQGKFYWTTKGSTVGFINNYGATSYIRTFSILGTVTELITPIFGRDPSGTDASLSYVYGLWGIQPSRTSVEQVCAQFPFIMSSTFTSGGTTTLTDADFMGEFNGNGFTGQIDYGFTIPQNPSYNTTFDVGDRDPSQTGETDIPIVDDIPLTTPAISNVSQFNRTFALSESQVKELADALWNADDTVYEEIVKGLSLMGGNPIEGLISLKKFPIDIANISTGSTENIKVGRTDLGIQGYKIDSYNAVFDLGSIVCPGRYQNFLDYEPYSSGFLVLPYVGCIKIPLSEFSGSFIKIRYIVDILTGACEAIIYNNNVPYTSKPGVIGIDIPMSSSNSAEYASRIMQASLNNVKSITTLGTSLATGDVSGSINAGIDTIASGINLSQQLNDTDFATTGTPSSSVGEWEAQYPYFVFCTPRVQTVALTETSYGSSIGYACNYTSTLSTQHGFTVCGNPNVSDMPGTQNEKNELVRLLTSGVYLPAK